MAQLFTNASKAQLGQPAAASTSSAVITTATTTTTPTTATTSAFTSTSASASTSAPSVAALGVLDALAANIGDAEVAGMLQELEWSRNWAAPRWWDSCYWRRWLCKIQPEQIIVF